MYRRRQVKGGLRPHQRPGGQEFTYITYHENGFHPAGPPPKPKEMLASVNLFGEPGELSPEQRTFLLIVLLPLILSGMGVGVNSNGTGILNDFSNPLIDRPDSDSDPNPGGKVLLSPEVLQHNHPHSEMHIGKIVQEVTSFTSTILHIGGLRGVERLGYDMLIKGLEAWEYTGDPMVSDTSEIAVEVVARAMGLTEEEVDVHTTGLSGLAVRHVVEYMKKGLPLTEAMKDVILIADLVVPIRDESGGITHYMRYNKETGMMEKVGGEEWAAQQSFLEIVRKIGDEDPWEKPPKNKKIKPVIVSEEEELNMRLLAAKNQHNLFPQIPEKLSHQFFSCNEKGGGFEQLEDVYPDLAERVKHLSDKYSGLVVIEHPVGDGKFIYQISGVGGWHGKNNIDILPSDFDINKYNPESIEIIDPDKRTFEEILSEITTLKEGAKNTELDNILWKIRSIDDNRIDGGYLTIFSKNLDPKKVTVALLMSYVDEGLITIDEAEELFPHIQFLEKYDSIITTCGGNRNFLTGACVNRTMQVFLTHHDQLPHEILHWLHFINIFGENFDDPEFSIGNKMINLHGDHIDEIIAEIFKILYNPEYDAIYFDTANSFNNNKVYNLRPIVDEMIKQFELAGKKDELIEALKNGEVDLLAEQIGNVILSNKELKEGFFGIDNTVINQDLFDYGITSPDDPDISKVLGIIAMKMVLSPFFDNK